MCIRDRYQRRVHGIRTIKMPIQYALIAKDKDTILAEYTDYSGNFQQLVRQLMAKLRPSAKQTFEAGNTSFHCLADGKLVFICMTDAAMKKAKAYKFLEEIKKRFYDTYQQDQISTAISFGLPFAEQLRASMVRFSQSRRTSSTTT
eukprot:TRINITY_DN2804_c0_g1_i6.p1 TRINITY_DN2804_c0_g1~~TRINITY_DN2804_c0_g1_i6.p1  ORF type:complete len:146 (+),score=4.44 TRINITY_DN2804_c0_g1_i6:77-514(+)